MLHTYSLHGHLVSVDANDGGHVVVAAFLQQCGGLIRQILTINTWCYVEGLKVPFLRYREKETKMSAKYRWIQI